MSEKLDDLLAKMNEAQNGRRFDDIPLKDEPFWGARAAYQKALHEANGVHIPFVHVKPENEIKQTSVEEYSGLLNYPSMTGKIDNITESTQTQEEIDANTKKQLDSLGL